MNSQAEPVTEVLTVNFLYHKLNLKTYTCPAITPTLNISFMQISLWSLHQTATARKVNTGIYMIMKWVQNN